MIVYKPIEVSKEQLGYILCGCFEGGSNHWINKIQVVNKDYKGQEFASDIIGYDGEIDIYVDENVYRLTKKILLEGLQMYLNKSKYKNFPNNSDAITYDNILQYALFKEIVSFSATILSLVEPVNSTSP